ncbi:hypothetical protein HELRODRAFT_184350 [Helobdella robusta]|uniref:Uncharacterized protein n=1 Tax=Helobdella robusta TaxID=6412 RepID=T1FL15_HELRO|nr:hypothetical protein HELRODRAFT_184350 [Helobdella robusta]ESO00739.1 hypothetical protein HELRODRAFT_184350 [Helobdella robusta]
MCIRSLRQSFLEYLKTIRTDTKQQQHSLPNSRPNLGLSSLTSPLSSLPNFGPNLLEAEEETQANSRQIMATLKMTAIYWMSLTDVLYEYMFLPNDSVQTTSSLSVSTSDSSSPLQPVAASLSAPQPTKSSSPSSSSKLNSNKSDDNRITCPPHNNNDASKLEKNDFEMTPTPSGSSSSRSDRSLSDQSAPSDDVITSLSSSANLLAVGPERGVKAGPIGRNILMSPPKLHTQPRGFAPASHNVPAAVKNTWGRSKIKDSKSFKAAKELDISDNDVGSKLKESKSFKITKDRDGDGSNDGGSSFSGNLLY